MRKQALAIQLEPGDEFYARDHKWVCEENNRMVYGRSLTDPYKTISLFPNADIEYDEKTENDESSRAEHS
jgi:hypothetical protein